MRQKLRIDRLMCLTRNYTDRTLSGEYCIPHFTRTLYYMTDAIHTASFARSRVYSQTR